MELSASSQGNGLRRALPLIERSGVKAWVALDPPGTAADEVRSLGVDLIVRHPWRYDFGEGAVRADMDAGWTPAECATEFVQDCKTRGWWPYAGYIMTPPAMAVATSPPDLLAWAISFQGYVHALLVPGKAAIVCNVPNGHYGYYVPAAAPGLPEPTEYGCQEYFWP